MKKENSEAKLGHRTERLTLRPLGSQDAAFILRLTNEPSWLRFIGDRGVRSEDDAKRYIEEGPAASYAQNGFGLFMTELTADQTAIGICGLVKRDTLEFPDIGFALLPEHWSKGYAFEAASEVVRHGREVLGLEKILAITVAENQSSIRLLERLGLEFEKTLELAGDDEPLKLFSS